MRDAAPSGFKQIPRSKLPLRWDYPWPGFITGYGDNDDAALPLQPDAHRCKSEMMHTVNLRSGTLHATRVDRSTKWGNPFTVASYGRGIAIVKHRAWLTERLLHEPEELLELRRELRGKDLACWCAPNPCHADFLLQLANPIFVFGSNLAGIHGAGAAKHALLHCDANWGQGDGLQGHSYAIPTKDYHLRPLQIAAVRANIRAFLHFAAENPLLEFHVTKVGCGLAGFETTEISPLFQEAPTNTYFYDSSWGRPIPAQRQGQDPAPPS